MGEGESASQSGQQIVLCCCIDYANLWSRLVAYIDLIFSIASLVHAIKLVASENIYNYFQSSKLQPETPIQTHTRHLNRIYTHKINRENPFSVISQFDPNPHAYLAATLMGFTLSVILLVGIHKRKPSCLLAWLMASYFEVVVEMLLCFVSVLSMGPTALFFIPFLLLQMFSIWSVAVYRQQLLEEKNTRSGNPVVEFQFV